jgi:4-hydroxyphenylpyruvate dioxygenase
MPGQGDFPLGEFAAEIFRIGYRGYWSLEIFNDRFRSGSAPGVALDGYRSLIALEDEVGRRPRTPIAPTMPAPASPTRVAFIEFAADDAEAETLGGRARSTSLSIGSRKGSRTASMSSTAPRSVRSG